MDEGCIEILAIGAFWLLIIAIVGGLAVVAALSVGVLALAVGFGESIARFTVRFVGSYLYEAAHPSVIPEGDEPAARGYFFGPSLAAVAGAAEQGGAGALLAAGRFSTEPSASDKVAKYATTAWNAGGLLGVMTGNLLGRVIFQLPAFIVCMVFWGVAAFVRLVLWAGQRVVILFRRVGYSCANEGCYARGKMPVYTCPNCGAHHASLWPNKYGVLYHTCKCGQNLPTLGALGRRNLAASCRVCGGPLQGGETSDVHLVVVGASGSGRSAGALAFVDALTAEGTGLVPADSAALSAYRSSVLSGAEPTGAPRITVLTHAGEGLDTGESVYVYDSPAEFSEAEAADQAFYDHIDAIAFTVSASQLLSSFSAQEGPAASRLELDEVYSRVLKTFDTHSGQSAAAIRRSRMAIVLTGMNADVEAAVAAAAKPEHDSLGKQIREWLFAVSQGNFVRLMESDFRQVRYFAVHPRSANAASDVTEYAQIVDWLLENRRGARKRMSA